MCRPKAEGGRRCGDPSHWRGVDLEELKPASRNDRADVDWDIPKPALTPAQVLDQYGNGIGVATLRRIEQLREVEEDMTGSIMAACPPDARLEGLQSRVKAPGSLARKVQEKLSTSSTATIENVLGPKLKDGIRYTVVSPTSGRLVATGAVMVERLRADGWAIESVENKYVEGNPYKGLHILASRDGVTAEVQVHSEVSLQVKNQTHDDYEIVREPDKYPAEAVFAADQRCRQAWAVIPTPQGMDGIRELGGCAVTPGKFQSPPLKPDRKIGEQL